MLRGDPIGIYDSGLGGLSVVRYILELLPHENVVYFGDSARAPYGGRSAHEIRSFSRQIIRFMQGLDAKLVVAACNTSSSLAIPLVRAEFRTPLMGLEPGLAEALEATKNGRVGVIATEGTIRSKTYQASRQLLGRSGATLLSCACPLLVPLVERGEVDTPRSREVLETYLAPLKQSGVDTLILGCTHYPFLSKQIGSIMGPEVCLIDPGRETAFAVARNLGLLGLLREGGVSWRRFFTSGAAEEFEARASVFLGQPVGVVERVEMPELPPVETGRVPEEAAKFLGTEPEAGLGAGYSV